MSQQLNTPSAEQITRYSKQQYMLLPSSHGSFVLYGDHAEHLAAKQAELDAARAEIERLKANEPRQAAKDGSEKPPFSCFRCDDGYTPLYCLNCANTNYENLNQLYTGEAQLHAELKTQVDGWKAEAENAEGAARILRSALVTFVGTENVEELEGMRTVFKSADIPEADRRGTLAAIQALLDTEGGK